MESNHFLYWLEAVQRPTPNSKTHQDRWRNVTGLSVLEALAYLISMSQSDKMMSLWQTLVQIEPLFLYQPKSSPSSLDGSYLSGIYSRLKGMVSGAWSIHAALQQEPDELALWLSETLRCWAMAPELEVGLIPSSRQPQDSLWDWIERIIHSNPNHYPCASATHWLKALLTELELYTHPSPAPTKINILNYLPNGTARVSTLELIVWEEGHGEIFADPIMMGLHPVYPSFHDAFDVALEVAQRYLSSTQQYDVEQLKTVDICWRVDLQHATHLEGGSHGVATTIGILFALLGRQVAPTFAVTGTIQRDGSIGKVAGVREKVLYALTFEPKPGQKQIYTVYVPAENFEDAEEGAKEAKRDLSEQPVVLVRHFSELIPHAYGELAQLYAICQNTYQLALQSASESLQVEIETWESLERHLISIPLEQERSQGELGASGRFTPVVWNDYRTRFVSAIILGDAGQGKTLFLLREVAHICYDALGKYHHQDYDGFLSGQFAVFVSSHEILPYLNPEQKSEANVFRNAVIDYLLEKYNLQSTLRHFLEEKIDEGKCLIALDALDEVWSARIQEQQTLMDYLLQHLDTKKVARLLCSCRTAFYTPESLGIAREDETYLRTLQPEHMEQLVRAWFEDNPKAGEMFWESLLRIQQENRVFFRMIGTPLLLSIACRIASAALEQRRPLPNLRRRHELYRLYLEVILNRWQRKFPGTTPIQRAEFRDLLADIAYRLLIIRDEGQPWTEATIRATISIILPELSSLRREKVYEMLIQTGLLILPTAWNAEMNPPHESTYLFLHATLGEYLCACSLVKQMGITGWSSVQKLLDEKANSPEWNEVFLFLAPLLPNATALLSLLCDATKDFTTRPRLALAANCIYEIYQ